MNRRDTLSLLSLTTLAAPTLALAATESAAAPAGIRIPKAELLYECDVTLGETLAFGATPEGTRRIIPITGGSFRGPGMSGVVVPGGADWNLSRSDGASLVEASYYLKTDDGVMLRITNRGVGAPAGRQPDGDEPFFMFTTPSFEAPAGKYAWLAQSVFIGTLGAHRNAKNAVLIRVFRIV